MKPLSGGILHRAKTVAKRVSLRRAPWFYWLWLDLRHGKSFEPETALLRHLCRRDRAAVDVGANYGVYTHFLLAHAETVHAFEPLPDLASLLRKAFRRLSGRVFIHEIALSDASGFADLKSPQDQPGRSTIDPHNALSIDVDPSAPIRCYRVVRRRLDSFVLPSVGFIKVDVEGHEPEVLRGAEGVLLRDKPSLLIEIEERHRAGSVEESATYLTHLGYAGFLLQGGRLLPLAHFELAEHQDPSLPETYVRNLVFVHGDRIGDIERLI